MVKHLIALFCVIFTTCHAASIPAATKCLNLQSNQQLQNLHKDCVQYENVTAPQRLGADTQKQLLCILYLSSYNRACEKSLKIPNGELTVFNISFVCSHINVLVDGAEDVAKLITDRLVCGGVCLDMDKGAVVPECNAAYFLNNLTRTEKEKAAIVAEEKPDVKDDQKQQQAAEPQPAVSQHDQEQQSQASVVAPKKINSNEVETLQHSGNQNQQPIPQEVQPAQQLPHEPQQQDSVVDEDVRAEHPAETPSDKQNNVDDDKKAPAAANPPPKEVNQHQVAPPASQPEGLVQGGQKILEEVPKAKDDNVKPVEVPPNNNNNIAAPEIQTSNNQEQSQQQTKDHIDSPLLINDETNNVDNQEVDMKFEDADDDEDDALDEQGEAKYNKPSIDEKVSLPQKPDKTYSSSVNTQTTVDGDSYFFSYFMMLCIIIVLFYVGYHNKQKIRAIVLEGPRGRRQHRSRRPNSANYHKLDSNLEEAITSSTANKSSSHVIY